MNDAEPELRYLKDILGKYFRKVLGWYGPTLNVERHQTDDPNVTRYVAMDAAGVAASIRVQVVRNVEGGCKSEENGVRDSPMGGLTSMAVSTGVELNQRMNRTPEAPPNPFGTSVARRAEQRQSRYP